MTAPSTTAWLNIRRGEAPLLLSIPHAGTQLVHIEDRVKSAWLARVDTDWWVDRLYDFASELDATIVSTLISRSVIDVNRGPSSRSLYPGMPTTELVPTTTFDGAPLYPDGRAPDVTEQALRRERYFTPYHAALQTELARLNDLHRTVVLYDAHSIRSRVPRLFEGELPMFNIGTYDGRSCSIELTTAVANACAKFSTSFVVNGRFKGGSITRTYGNPALGVHAIQMELACRAYMDEPEDALSERNWPPAYAKDRAEAVRVALMDVLIQCVAFGRNGSR
jgi:N-formylglutamate deformylase